jgi:hypothetical protein
MSRNEHTCGAKSTAEPLRAGALQLCCLGLALLLATGAAAGKLDGVRDATAETGDDDEGDGDDSAAAGAGEALADAAGDAFMDAILSAASARAGNVRFAAYPYADGFDGWIVDLAADGEEGPPAPPSNAPLAPVSFRFSLDYAYDWGEVQRPAIALALDTSSGFGLRADYTSYVEPLPRGALDYLGIGTLDATLRVVDAPRVALYLGLGWRYLADGDALRNGFNCLLAIDAFPVEPLVVSAIAEGGNLGAAGFLHGRLALGALIQRLEIFAGYDATIIAGAEGDPIVFHGPVAGIRGWL